MYYSVISMYVLQCDLYVCISVISMYYSVISLYVLQCD